MERERHIFIQHFYELMTEINSMMSYSYSVPSELETDLWIAFLGTENTVLS